MSVRRLALLVTLAAMLGGCAGASGLAVRYPEAGANRALLASVASRRVEIRPVADARLDTTRIGTRPKDGTNLVTERPVADIVGEALAVEVAKNGHTVAAAPSDVILAADVEEFWLDVVRGYGSTQYVGKVAFSVIVLDGRTGDRLATRRYVGIKRRPVDTPSDDAAREVMDAALARAMRDLATDPALVKAFAGMTTAAAPRSPTHP